MIRKVRPCAQRPMPSLQLVCGSAWDLNPGPSDPNALGLKTCYLPSLLYLPRISSLDEEFLDLLKQNKIQRTF